VLTAYIYTDTHTHARTHTWTNGHDETNGFLNFLLESCLKYFFPSVQGIFDLI